MKNFSKKTAFLLAVLMTLTSIPTMAFVRTPVKGIGFEKEMIGNGDNQDYYKIEAADSALQYFKTDKTVVAVGVNVPSFNDNIGKITIKVFKWAGDYGSTIKTKPLAEKPTKTGLTLPTSNCFLTAQRAAVNIW